MGYKRLLRGSKEPDGLSGPEIKFILFQIELTFANFREIDFSDDSRWLYLPVKILMLVLSLILM